MKYAGIANTLRAEVLDELEVGVEVAVVAHRAEEPAVRELVGVRAADRPRSATVPRDRGTAAPAARSSSSGSRCPPSAGVSGGGRGPRSRRRWRPTAPWPSTSSGRRRARASADAERLEVEDVEEAVAVHHLHQLRRRCRPLHERHADADDGAHPLRVQAGAGPTRSTRPSRGRRRQRRPCRSDRAVR